MKSINEIFVPSGWVRTTKEVSSNPIRASWPDVANLDSNIFDLSIITHSNVEDELLDCDEKLSLFFVSGNNEVMLSEETSYSPRQLVDDQKENINESGTIKEKIYSLKVYDRDTKSTMFYDVKLARVEMEKEVLGFKDDGSLSEHLEVIAKLDDDNPFDTDFDEPVEKEEKEK